MSEDWDLFAVVRSCSSSVSTATINTEDGGNGKQQNPAPPLFQHIHGARDREPSCCNELQDSCKAFIPTSRTSWSSPPLMKQKEEVLELESQDHKPPLAVRVFPPSSSSVFVFRGQRDQQSQAPLRSRKRKNQQKRSICHVTQENLSSDMWAWRKYGQKPIKGSPYPRNYYRCSSSKGCLARKQVERSNLDPNIFIVTYTGDHTHPRPTHRNSLAGSTRNKSLPVPKPPSPQTVVPGSHLSPTTPLKDEDDDVQGTNGDEYLDEEEEEEDQDDDDVDDLLIPNFAVPDPDDFFFAPPDPPPTVLDDEETRI